MSSSFHSRTRSSNRVLLQAPGANAATLGALALVAVHLLMRTIWHATGPFAVGKIYEVAGLSWPGIEAGMIWQILTHSFLHGNWPHLVINAALFYYAAARLSHVLSSKRIVVLFLITALGAGLAQVLMQAIFPGLREQVLVGASGGIMGMLLGYFALSPQSRMLFLPVSALNLSKGVLISSGLLFLMTPALEIPLMSELGGWISSAIGPSVFQMAHLVHFVGGLMGWLLISRFFPRLLTASDLKLMREKRERAELSIKA